MRLPGWEHRFEDAIKRHFLELQPQWGSNDCCLFVAGVIDATTGIDPARHLRGTYSSKREALAIIAAAGGIAALFEGCLRRWGIAVDPIPVHMAQRADVIEFDTGERHEDGARVTALGVAYVGARIACLSEKLGIFLPLRRGIRAWRV